MSLAPIPFRVRIGVTGHRSLPDRADLARRIRDLLQGAPGRWFDPPMDTGKSKTPVVFTVVSALAEGADRLVAEEVLKLPGSELEAVLPLAAAEYQRFFSSPGSRSGFRNLLRRAVRTVIMENPGGDPRQPAVRERAYEAAGRYVVDHCDLLLAVWDGRPARGRGGTAEIVAYARRRERPLAVIAADPAAAARSARE